MNLPKTLIMPLWVASEWDHKVFYENQSICGSLVLSIIFKTVFEIFLTPLVSQAILWFHVSKWLLKVKKHHFGRKIVQQIQKWPWKFFRCKSCKSLNFMVLGHPSKKYQNYSFVFFHIWKTWHLKNFHSHFLNLMDIFTSRMMFLNSKKSFQSLRPEYSLRTD
jgi:hypothetical protein